MAICSYCQQKILPGEEWLTEMVPSGGLPPRRKAEKVHTKCVRQAGDRDRRFVRTTLESLFHVHPNETHNILNEMGWFEAAHVPDIIVEEIINTARDGIIEGYLDEVGEGYREGMADR